MYNSLPRMVIPIIDCPENLETIKKYEAAKDKPLIMDGALWRCVAMEYELLIGHKNAIKTYEFRCVGFVESDKNARR